MTLAHKKGCVYFEALFFAGDRAAVMLQIKRTDVLRLPDNSRFLFNRVWTKTLRLGDANVFEFKGLKQIGLSG